MEHGQQASGYLKTKNGRPYGLPNIRKVAEKYSGDIDITFEDGTFDLCVMLMPE